MPARYTHVLQIFCSLPDGSGNRYHAFTMTEMESGVSVNGLGAGRSNLEMVAELWTGTRELYPTVFVVVQELPFRRFKRLTHDWSYAGCRAEDVISDIQKNFEAGKKMLDWLNDRTAADLTKILA